jgi:uncharacterized protein DUF6494
LGEIKEDQLFSRARKYRRCGRWVSRTLNPSYTKPIEEPTMNEDVFNTSIRKFLKTLGVTAQREIEKAVRQALADGRIKGDETWPAKATVTIAGVGLALEIDGEIELA